MYYSMAILILTISCCQVASAQPVPKQVIVTVSDSKGYLYFPPAALNDSVDALLIRNTADATQQHTSPLKIYWVSNCTDGYFNLVVTPEQIYLQTSHDNPNPNRLCWVVHIDSFQYNRIRWGLKNKKPQGLVNTSEARPGESFIFFDKKYQDVSLPRHWTDSTSKKFDNNCELAIHKQVVKYFALFNSYITDEIHKIRFPDYQELLHSKSRLMSGNLEEINDWLPGKFQMPVLKNE